MFRASNREAADEPGVVAANATRDSHQLLIRAAALKVRRRRFGATAGMLPRLLACEFLEPDATPNSRPRHPQSLSARLSDYERHYSLGVLVLGQPKFSAKPLTNQVFLDLPGDCQREAIDEAHIARQLVMSDLSAAELANLFLGCGCAFT